VPTQSDDPAAIDTLVEAIEQGRDGIDVPAELIEAGTTGTPQRLSQSIALRVRAMAVGERIKLALLGNKEARAVLLRDSNRIIPRFVLQNPRITEEEIVAITNSRTVDEELLRIIAEHRAWTKNYQVRLGLVSNPRTPIGIAMRLLSTVEGRDLRRLAKSKNIPAAVAAQARRMVASRGARGM
jgi:hypothetical protein